MKPATPRTRKSPTSITGIHVMSHGSFSTKVPSRSGFKSAGSAGSVIAAKVVPRIDAANMRQYGRTCRSRRR